MAKSHLKDFSNIANGGVDSVSQKEMIMEAEVVSIETVDTHEDEARIVVRRNMLWSMGIGLIPLPIIDLIGMTGFQIRMLKQLSDLYEIPFSAHRAKNILASLIGGMGAVLLGRWLSQSFIKSIPVVGGIAGVAGTPIIGGAFTYAVGVVFIQHFESGGTFLNFKPQEVREYFREKYEEGLNVATSLKESPAL